ncbi:MAG: helix-turn-helix transcriptional regulator [Desulfotomaculaceae bacterium]|nr:helix-turn-helix transcriptional regulator [Desulfotomaculaceae bacterium]
MLFGDRLKKLRRDAGLTQAELGKRIGVSERVIGYYEANARFPNKQETLQKISEVFDVSIDSLVGKEGSFLQRAAEKYGYTGSKQAQKVLQDVQALFAGGELPEADRDMFFRLLTEMYFETKQINKKYGRKEKE